MTRFPTPALAVVALLASWAGAWSLAGTPYGAIVDDLLSRFHAQERACRVAHAPAEAPAAACFVVDPGRAALLAEAIEAYLDEHAGAVVRGPWSSANGTHRVALSLPDAGWGALELWLVEGPGHRVEGRFEHLPERGR